MNECMYLCMFVRLFVVFCMYVIMCVCMYVWRGSKGLCMFDVKCRGWRQEKGRGVLVRSWGVRGGSELGEERESRDERGSE